MNIIWIFRTGVPDIDVNSRKVTFPDEPKFSQIFIVMTHFIIEQRQHHDFFGSFLFQPFNILFCQTDIRLELSYLPAQAVDNRFQPGKFMNDRDLPGEPQGANCTGQ